jgi:hypothetical protein
MTTDREERKMPFTAHADGSEKELDFRENDGIEVVLLWCEGDEYLIVEVVDTRTFDAFRLEVAATEVLDAFHHPYAYAASHGVEYVEPGSTRPSRLCDSAEAEQTFQL